MKISKTRLMQIIKEEFEANSSPYALYIQKEDDNNFKLVIYLKDTYKVIGMLAADKTSEPCIPETYEVSGIAVDSRYQGKKIGLDLYRYAMAIAKREDAGLTSDHSYGTKAKAASFWSRLKNNSPLADKKETPMGNDTFDYPPFDPTDPDDDCDEGYEGNPATDHSFIMKDSEASKAEQEIQQLERNHRIAFVNLFSSENIPALLKSRIKRLQNTLDPTLDSYRTDLRNKTQAAFEIYLIMGANQIFRNEYF
jgi:GNAT superfamily N-acetyltransferase